MQRYGKLVLEERGQKHRKSSLNQETRTCVST
uniref:Uncharacterized protein n=1 Tax=Arundo donax TaxID=35708 RepID=A0A0A9HWZ1_ARUDO